MYYHFSLHLRKYELEDVVAMMFSIFSFVRGEDGLLVHVHDAFEMKAAGSSAKQGALLLTQSSFPLFFSALALSTWFDNKYIDDFIIHNID